MPLTHRTSASTLRLRRRAASRTLAVALATSLALACAPAAHASGRSYTVSSDGTTVTVTGTAGVDDISVARHYDGRVTVHDAEPGPGCELFYPDDDRSPAVCPVGPGGIQVNALGGNDRVSATVWGDPALSLGDFRIDLGDGNDAFSAQKVDGPVTVRGGAGADTIEGSRQGDDLDGGPGNDTIEGYWGADIIHGGEGDDQVIGDEGGQRAGDLIDGGPGLDRTDDWLDAEDAASITLDGKANDGFADEADNVVSVEKIRMGAAATFTGDDGVNVVVSGEVAGSAVLLGFGGNDELSGGDRSDRIEGGAGADQLQGGYGSDTIVGGPGQDSIDGDRPGRCNEMHCDLSVGLAADTIDAVDGERDAITCGAGDDVVIADVVDSVDVSCESVTRVAAPAGPKGAAGTTGAGAGTGSGTASGGAASGGGPATTVVIPPSGGTVALPGTAITLSGRASVSTLRARGLTVTVGGRAKGARVRVTLLRRGRTIATGTARAGGSGEATIRVRLTAAGRKAIRAGAKAQTLTLVCGKERSTIALSR